MKGKSAKRPLAPRRDEVRREDADWVVRRHLRLGWGALLVFLTLGVALEALHAFKYPGYLNPSHATRRLMWTLAHAHGTLLGLLNIGFAFSATQLSPGQSRRRVAISNLLRASTVLLPGGFFLGGVSFHGGDPGLGIVLVPAGAALLLAGVGLLVAALRSP